MCSFNRDTEEVALARLEQYAKVQLSQILVILQGGKTNGLKGDLGKCAKTQTLTTYTIFL